MNDPFFKKLRKKIRARRNKKRLEREYAHYREGFRRRGLSIPDDAEIRTCVGRYFPDLRPRPKGDLHILAVYHDFNWEGVCLGPALAEFGTVRWLDWNDPSIAGGRQPHERDWKARMNAGLITLAAGYNEARPFDVVFTYLSGGQMTLEGLGGLRALGAPIVNLALNDKEAFVGKIRGGMATGARDICRYFDLCWTSTRDALEKYVVEGARPLYLPEGANPRVHRSYEEQKLYDVSFVGRRYGNRPEIISLLNGAGVRVEAFGPGWPNGALTTDEMVRTWSRSRINLGFGGVVEYEETFCLKGRDFEVPMSGGLYLTEHHDELGHFWDLGREIITYTGFKDLLEKIKELLDNPAKAEAIRMAGQKRALREHTWEKRFERVFRILGVLR